MSSSQQMAVLDLPCLAFHDCDRSTVVISMPDHKRIAAAGDEILRGKIICPTAQGLLLVRDPDSMTTFLFNPTNNDKVGLPSLTEVDDMVLIDSHCLLSDEPASPHCVYEYDIGSHVLPYPDGEEDQIEKNVICPVAACQGKFYFNATATVLRVLDLSSHEPALGAITIDDAVAADGSYG
ncbi:hypothetical protein C2845_PM07G31730 [Panicum miliaceum]|uniref:KIB1-4 beta-propeller domain-containing protein n=1 Tax=Panicum miliaceum TaxID=4540 RepID=A0A3L6SM11_PANMI|nr:hypothetical protein C2845_PM07G31730 [Panicum miliaceum]